MAMAIGPNVVDDCEGMTEEDYWRGMDEPMQDEEGDEPFCNCRGAPDRTDRQTWAGERGGHCNTQRYWIAA